MSMKPVEIKAWMGDGTEYVVRYYKEADFDAKEQECAEYQRALSEAQTVEGELRTACERKDALLRRTQPIAAHYASEGVAKFVKLKDDIDAELGEQP